MRAAPLKGCVPEWKAAIQGHEWKQETDRKVVESREHERVQPVQEQGGCATPLDIANLHMDTGQLGL